MSEGSFEAKLTAKRETAAGIYLTVQVQPEDYQAELATLRVGSTLMLGWAEIVNTAVEPIEVSPVDQRIDRQVPNLKAEGSNPSGAATKERRPFASLPLSQQAALRCGDERFWNFLSESHGIVPNADWPTVAASYIRTFCAVASRGEIGIDPNATAKWVNLEAEYQSYLTDEMYAEARR